VCVYTHTHTHKHLGLTHLSICNSSALLEWIKLFYLKVFVTLICTIRIHLLQSD